MDFLPFPDDPPEFEVSGSGQGNVFLDGMLRSSLAVAHVKSAVADAEFDFSFPDDPPDLEILGFRLPEVPVLLDKKTWSSLTAVILLHVTLVCLLWLSPKPPAASPKSIEVQLVSMLGGSGPQQGSLEGGKDEQAGALAPPAAAPPVVPPVKNEPPDSNLSIKTDGILPAERKIHVPPSNTPRKLRR